MVSVVGLEADLDGGLVAIEDGIGKEVGGDLSEARPVASDVQSREAS